MTSPTSLFDRVRAHLDATAASVAGVQTGVEEIRSDVVNSFNGWTGLWGRAESQQALAEQAATVAALSAAVAALQTAQNNQANSGNSAIVDFTLRPDAGSLGADFSQTYSGPGVGTWQIGAGKAFWQRGFSTSRSCIAVYNAKQTLTDYQMVGMAAASKPAWYNSTFKGINYLYGRSNAAGTAYIYAALDAFNLELGCVVPNSTVQIVTINGTPTGGTFALASGVNTYTAAFNAAAATVQTAVRAWAGIYAAVTVTGTGPYTFTFPGTAAAFTVNQALLTGGTAAAEQATIVTAGPGFKTVFATYSSFAYKSNGVYWLRCGTIGGARIFQVLEGSTPILTHTEIGVTSLMGAGFRHTGIGVLAEESGLVYELPGKISAFAFSDNTPASTLGTFARVYRAATADTATSSAAVGDRAMPASTFDTVDRITPNITFTAATNRFTVTETCTYMFAFRATSDNAYTSTGVAPTCLINGVTYTEGRLHQWSDIGDGVSLKAISETFIVYLEAGQTIEPGYWHSNANTVDFQGDATGHDTWMTLTRIPL